MNGRQHYDLAEKLLRGAAEREDIDADLLITMAQVHATLALAAATADQGVELDVAHAWRVVTR